MSPAIITVTSILLEPTLQSSQETPTAAPAPVSHDVAQKSNTSLILSTIAAVLAILGLLMYIVRSLWKRRNKAPCSTLSGAQTRRIDGLEKALPSEQSGFTTSTRPSADARSQRTFAGRSSVSTRHLPSTPTSRTVSIDDQSSHPVHIKRPTSLEISYRNLLASSSFSKKPKSWDEDNPPSQAAMNGGLGSFFSKPAIRPFNPTRDRSQAASSFDIELDIISRDDSPTRNTNSQATTALLAQIHSPVPKLVVTFPSPLLPSFVAPDSFAAPEEVIDSRSGRFSRLDHDTRAHASNLGVNQNVSKNAPPASSRNTNAPFFVPAPKPEDAAKATMPEFGARRARKNVDDAHEDIKRAYTEFINMVKEGAFDDPSDIVAPPNGMNDGHDVLAPARASTGPLEEAGLGSFNSRLMSLIINDLADSSTSVQVDANKDSLISAPVIVSSATQEPPPKHNSDLGVIHEVSIESDEFDTLGTFDPTWNSERDVRGVEREGSQVEHTFERGMQRQMLPRPMESATKLSSPLFSPALSSGSSKAPSSATSIAFSTPSILSASFTPSITQADDDERSSLPPKSPIPPIPPSPEVPSQRTSKGWMRIDKVQKLKRRPPPLDLTHSASGDMGLQKVELDPKGYHAIGFGRAASSFSPIPIEKDEPVYQTHPRSSQSTGSLYSRDTDQSGEGSNRGPRESKSSSSLAKNPDAHEDTHIFMRSRRRSRVNGRQGGSSTSRRFLIKPSRRSYRPPPPNPVLPPELEAVYPQSDPLDHFEKPESSYFEANTHSDLNNRPRVRPSLVEGLRDTLRRIPSLRKLVGTELLESTATVTTSSSPNTRDGTLERQKQVQTNDNDGNLSNVSNLRASDDVFVIGDDSDRLDSP